MQIVYQGPHTEGVTIAATGQHTLPGEPIDVPDDVAARLLEQDAWTEAPAPETKKGRQTPAATDQADGQEDDQ